MQRTVIYVTCPRAVSFSYGVQGLGSTIHSSLVFRAPQAFSLQTVPPTVLEVVVRRVLGGQKELVFVCFFPPGVVLSRVGIYFVSVGHISPVLYALKAKVLAILERE